MTKRTSIKTTKEQIIKWAIPNLGDTLGVDASEMHSHCWRCGYENNIVGSTERCHVIPDSLGGKDIPSNYRLLCHSCHKENTNVNDPAAMDKWIKETMVTCYNTFWKIREIYNSIWEDVTNHWGEKLNKTTKKWMVNEFNKRLEKEGIWVDNQTMNCLK